MHIYTRRSIAAIFIIIFFILTPPLIMITSGYLYNLKKNKFEKTGLLIINSEPTGADILLNNTNPRNWWSLYFPFLSKREFKTPARINYLPPNDYEINLTLNNFHAWKITTTIEPGTTTFLENIKLWPTATAQEVILPLTSLAALSPDGKRLAFIRADNGELNIYNTQAKTNLSTGYLTTDAKKIIWSKNGEKILSQDINGWRYLNLNNDQIQNIPLPPQTEIIAYLENDTLIYYNDQKALYALENNWQDSTLLYPEAQAIQAINDYQNEAWAIAENELVSLTASKNFLNPLAEKLSLILFQDKDQILILTQKNKILLFQKKTESWQVLTINQAINNIRPLKDNQWLWWNEFEIGFFNTTTQKNTLLTRLSDRLIDTLPLLDELNQHWLIITQNKVVALDLQLEEKPIITELFTLNTIENAALDRNQKTLWLTTKDESQNWHLSNYSFQ